VTITTCKIRNNSENFLVSADVSNHGAGTSFNWEPVNLLHVYQLNPVRQLKCLQIPSINSRNPKQALETNPERRLRHGSSMNMQTIKQIWHKN